MEVDDTGRVRRWDAYFYSAGGSGFILLRNPQDGVVRERVAALLQKLAADPANGIEAVWNQDDLRRMGAEPRASFGLDMKESFYTAAGHDVLIKKSTSRGGHGFGPSRADLHASLLMRGPDVPAGGNLGIVRMSQIGPTVAAWFGVALSPSADAPLTLSPPRP